MTRLCFSSHMFGVDLSGVRLADACATAGLHGIELCFSVGGSLDLSAPQEACAAEAAQFAARGVQVCCVSSPLHGKYAFASNSPAARQAAVQIAEALLDRAAWFGAAVVRISCGVLYPRRGVDGLVSYEQAMERMIEGVAALLDRAETLGLTLAIAAGSHRFLMSPLEVRRVVDDFHSSAVGVAVNLNDLQVHGCAHDWLAILGRRVAAICYTCPPPSTREERAMPPPGNLPRIRQVLEDIGYAGPVIADGVGGLDRVARSLRLLVSD